MENEGEGWGVENEGEGWGEWRKRARDGGVEKEGEGCVTRCVVTLHQRSLHTLPVWGALHNLVHPIDKVGHHLVLQPQA